MAIKRRIKKLSKIVLELLAEGESERADFKRTPDGISVDDLVAFANSDTGGYILAGVDEQLVNNVQIGVVRGCDVSDAAILQVLNKSVSCIPPVPINVYIENLDEKPILRVEIRSSETKPHCTPKGVYSRRDGTRNRHLHPSELLKVFLENEANAFAQRFEAAAQLITEELSELQSSLGHSIQNMSDQLGWAEFQLGDTESTLDNIQGLVAKLSIEADHANSRLRAMFQQDKRVDPVRERARLKYFNSLIQQIREDESLMAHVVAGGQVSLKIEGNNSADLTDNDAKELVKIAARHIHDSERDKKYKIVVKSPKDCSDAEIVDFSKLVADGGEVSEGISNRAKRAFRLGFVIYDGAVVGTAAVKRPATNYRRTVFKKALSSLNPDNFEYELGWIFLDSEHRQKGQMTRLIDEILGDIDRSSMFATTRASNSVMQEMLLQLKFLLEGSEYGSEQHSDDTIKLFVRAADLKQKI